MKQRFSLPFHLNSKINYLHQWYQYSLFTSGPQPRSHPWSNTHLQTAHFNHLQNCLFRTQRNQSNPSLSLCLCHKTFVCSFVSVMAWLLQLSSRCILKVSSQETSENVKQLSPSNLQVIKIWPCFPTSAVLSLASNLPTNQLQSLFRLFFFLSLAPVLNTLPTFSRFTYLPDSFVPPVTLVSFNFFLSMQSQLANVLLHTKAVESGTNFHITPGMLFPLTLLKPL